MDVSITLLSSSPPGCAFRLSALFLQPEGCDVPPVVIPKNGPPPFPPFPLYALLAFSMGQVSNADELLVWKSPGELFFQP